MGLFGIKPSVKSEQEARAMAPQWQKIVDDCIRLVDTTVKPDVFFSRYDLLVETLTKLAGTERYIKYKGGKPSQLLAEISKPKTREASISTFITRSHKRALQDAAALKTEKSRLDKVGKFFDDMARYSKKMYAPNLALLDELRGKGL